LEWHVVALVGQFITGGGFFLLSFFSLLSLKFMMIIQDFKVVLLYMVLNFGFYFFDL
jgi:hypothetical protein